MSLISPKKILPSGPSNAELLIIGEAPGYDEDTSGRPFEGEAGGLLDEALGIIGLSRNHVRVTNLCNYRPNNNNWEHLEGSPQLAEGIKDAQDFIKENKDRLKFVLLLGDKPLSYIGRRKGISHWRGSVIQQDGVNYFASYHPSYVLRDRSKYGLFTFDFRKLQRFLKEGYTKPDHRFTINPQGLELEECLREIEQCKEVTVDLEGVKGTTKILCCGFGLSKSRAICFINPKWDGLDYSFSTSIRRILENRRIKKIFQNGFGYDVEVLRENEIYVDSEDDYTFDTMIAAHVLEPELPYKLEYLTSIYTDEPYYKDKGKSALPDDDDKGWSEAAIKRDGSIIWDYNCTDCIVDYEIAIKQREELKERQLILMYDYKHSLIETGQYLSRPGLYLDVGRKELLRISLKSKWKYYQEIINTIAGYPVNSAGNSKSLHKFLLGDLKLPERYSDGKITLDEGAITSYIALCQGKIDEFKTEAKIEEWTLKLASCKCVLLIRNARTTLSRYINVKFAIDFRIRSVYNLPAATETGRGLSHKWIDGTGWNGQTVPREVLEFTDEEMILIEAKLNAA